MISRRQLGWAALIGLAVILSAIGWAIGKDAPPARIAQGASLGATSMANAEPPPVSSAALAPTDVQAPSRSASISAEVKFSLGERFAQLARSSDPRDAFRAYQIVKGCVSLRDSEKTFRQTRQSEKDPIRVAEFQPDRLSLRLEQSCGDLTADDLGLSKRMKLLERAAAAGVPMAALYLANEGPSGDPQALLNRWDDPAVQDWRNRVVGLIRLAAEKGDTTALNSLAEQYETGSGLVAERDMRLALQYAVAQQLVHEAQTGRKIWGGEANLKRLAEQLDPPAANVAREAGRLMSEKILAGGGK